MRIHRRIYRISSAVAAQDAFIFVTLNITASQQPECFDVSRPWGQFWGGKPALVVSNRSLVLCVLAHHVLRQSLVFLDANDATPELYIGNTDKLADKIITMKAPNHS